MIINLMAAITNKELLLLLMIVIIVFIVLLTALGIIFITVLRKRKPIVKVVMSPNGMEDRPQVAQGQQADRIIEPARNNGPAIPEPTRIVDPDHIVDPTPVAATAQSSEPVHIVEAVVVEPVPVVEPTPEVEEEVVEEPATEVEEEVVEEPAAEVEEEVVEEPAAEVEEEVVEEEPEVQSVQPIPLFIPDLVEDESEEEDEEEAAEEVTEVEEEETVVRSVDEKTGLTITVRYRKSFTAKLIQSKDETKAFYTYLKNVLLSYKKVKSRISWGQENFNHGRNNIVRFTMRGKSLCLYFALNPDDYAETKYKVERAESKKYEEIPCMYRIKNGRRAKYAVDLIAAVMEKFGIPYGAEQNENYYKPYETTEQLIEEGLIKKVVKEETFTEYVVTEEAQPIAEEQLVEEAASVEEVAAEVAPEAIEEVSEEIAPEAVEEPVAAVEEVTEEPAKEAEEEVIEEEAEAEEFEEVIDPEQAEIIEQSKQEIEQKLRETVTAAEVNSYISDEVTVSLVKKKRTDNVRLKGEKAIVNIDTLSENFRRGERVNLEKLKAKKLVGKNVVSVKVLARGALTKPLTVEAHDFSMEAMKMIIITGGTVIKA